MFWVFMGTECSPAPRFMVAKYWLSHILECHGFFFSWNGVFLYEFYRRYQCEFPLSNMYEVDWKGTFISVFLRLPHVTLLPYRDDGEATPTKHCFGFKIIMMPSLWTGIFAPGTSSALHYDTLPAYVTHVIGLSLNLSAYIQSVLSWLPIRPSEALL
jgi:hypothetical protein